MYVSVHLICTYAGALTLLAQGTAVTGSLDRHRPTLLLLAGLGFEDAPITFPCILLHVLWIVHAACNSHQRQASSAVIFQVTST